MKETLNLWLSNNGRLPGLLASGIRYPDSTSFTQTLAGGFPAMALENGLRCVADTFLVLQLNRLPADNIRWVYDKASLYCARRTDGICLVLIAAKDAPSSGEAIDRLLAEFHKVGRPISQA